MEGGSKETMIGEATHAPHQDVVVAPVAEASSDNAAFLGVFEKRLPQSGDHVGGGREAPLASGFKRTMLSRQVHRQRAGLMGLGLQHIALDQRERHSGHAFQAFVGRGHRRE
jgi:hypothetical protein